MSTDSFLFAMIRTDMSQDANIPNLKTTYYTSTCKISFIYLPVSFLSVTHLNDSHSLSEPYEKIETKKKIGKSDSTF